MDEARAAPRRLERIEALDREPAGPAGAARGARASSSAKSEAWARARRAPSARLDALARTQEVVAAARGTALIDNRRCNQLDVPSVTPPSCTGTTSPATRQRDGPYRRRAGTPLGDAAGERRPSACNRIRSSPGDVVDAAHAHGAEEEIFFVLDGSGVSWQDGAARTRRRARATCLVQLAGVTPHAPRRQRRPRVLAFGTRRPDDDGVLPAARRSRLARRAPGPRRLASIPRGKREAAVGPSDSRRPARDRRRSSPSTTVEERRATVRHVRAAPAASRSSRGAPYAGSTADAPPARSRRAAALPLRGRGGLRRPRRRRHAPARAGGTRTHGSDPATSSRARPERGVAHLPRGRRRAYFLAYGTRDRTTSCYYPRSNKIFFAGSASSPGSSTSTTGTARTRPSGKGLAPARRTRPRRQMRAQFRGDP